MSKNVKFAISSQVNLSTSVENDSRRVLGLWHPCLRTSSGAVHRWDSARSNSCHSHDGILLLLAAFVITLWPHLVCCCPSERSPRFWVVHLCCDSGRLSGSVVFAPQES